MVGHPFILVCPATRGLSLALTRHYLRTTNLPVYATYRTGPSTAVAENILTGMDVDKSRLKLLELDLMEDRSIEKAAAMLSDSLPKSGESYLHTAFFTGGILYPERQAAELNVEEIQRTFQTNVIAHLLLIKHFSQFLPSTRMASVLPQDHISRWVHISARVGSISDNRLGGWYSYRASKAALNQVVKTFDLQLKQKRTRAMCVGAHPGTVKTDLSKEYWSGVAEGKLFQPEYAAEKLSKVVRGLTEEQRGRIWDWKGEEILP
ncbi:NAD-P-binding protein [Amylostereum chailletii]|nr:NAD-P-binding protein [Amylostereum chailletii]